MILYKAARWRPGPLPRVPALVLRVPVLAARPLASGPIALRPQRHRPTLAWLLALGRPARRVAVVALLFVAGPVAPGLQRLSGWLRGNQRVAAADEVGAARPFQHLAHLEAVLYNFRCGPQPVVFCVPAPRSPGFSPLAGWAIAW